MTSTTKAPKPKALALQSYSEVLDHAVLARRIAEGVDVNVRIGGPRSGTPPIEAAAERCDPIATRMLLEAGAAHTWGKSERGSAVVAACQGALRHGEAAAIEVCSLLVAAGADPNGVSRDPKGPLLAIDAPITWAVSRSQCELVKKLHELGADLNAPLARNGGAWRDSTTTTPLEDVVDSLVNGNDATKALLNESVVVTLLRLGADDSVLVVDGSTPFLRCVSLGLTEVVEYYVRERGEDVGQRINGKTLLQHARTPEMREFLRSLKSAVGIEQVVQAQQSTEAPARTLGMGAL